MREGAGPRVTFLATCVTVHLRYHRIFSTQGMPRPRACEQLLARKADFAARLLQAIGDGVAPDHRGQSPQLAVPSKHHCSLCVGCHARQTPTTRTASAWERQSRHSRTPQVYRKHCTLQNACPTRVEYIHACTGSVLLRSVTYARHVRQTQMRTRLLHTTLPHHLIHPFPSRCNHAACHPNHPHVVCQGIHSQGISERRIPSTVHRGCKVHVRHCGERHAGHQLGVLLHGILQALCGLVHW